MSEFVCLYDRNFIPLGSWALHPAERWSLKRKAYEQDEFEASCRGWENSGDACFVALHEDTGAMKYLSFCGIPVTKEGITEVTGIDCRTIFNQTIYVDYASMGATTVEGLYAFLMGATRAEGSPKEGGCIAEAGISLGISYSVDVGDLSFAGSIPEGAITATREIRNVWDEIQRLNAMLDVCVEAVGGVGDDGNYALSFKATRVINSRNIRLSDYDYEAELDRNAANAAIAVYGSETERYYLYKDNSIGSSYDAEKCIFPVIAETFESEESIDEAREEALSLLNANRFQDRVEISLGGAQGSRIEDMDFSWFGVLYGYNPADAGTAKTLPVSALSEDSDGNRAIEFGRLSEYWFMDE